MQKLAVGLEMQRSTGLDNLPIPVQEGRRSKPFTLSFVFYLRIGKGNPDLADFLGSKEAFYALNLDTQKAHIRHSGFYCRFRAPPDAIPLDVYAYEVLFGMLGSQVNGIFTLAATQLQHYRLALDEETAVPVPLHGVVENFFLHRGLDNVGKGFQFGEML